MLDATHSLLLLRTYNNNTLLRPTSHTRTLKLHRRQLHRAHLNSHPVQEPMEKTSHAVNLALHNLPVLPEHARPRNLSGGSLQEQT